MRSHPRTHDELARSILAMEAEERDLNEKLQRVVRGLEHLRAQRQLEDSFFRTVQAGPQQATNEVKRRQNALKSEVCFAVWRAAAGSTGPVTWQQIEHFRRELSAAQLSGRVRVASVPVVTSIQKVFTPRLNRGKSPEPGGDDKPERMDHTYRVCSAKGVECTENNKLSALAWALQSPPLTKDATEHQKLQHVVGLLEGLCGAPPPSYAPRKTKKRAAGFDDDELVGRSPRPPPHPAGH